MPEPDFSLGQDDDDVLWALPLYDDDGNQLDATGATVQMYYRIDDDSADGVTVDGEVVDKGVGNPAWIGHTFVAAETAAPGTYNVQFLVTLDGERLTYPARRYAQLLIKATP